MTPIVYAAGAVLTLIALGLIVVPLLRYRTDSTVGLTLPAIVLLFPMLVAGTYAVVNTYPWGDDVAVARPAPTPASQQPPVAEMITELAARLEREPDVEGYILLGRSYISLQRFADASDAWHKAWELTEGKDPEVSLGYAEALILSDQRTLKTGAADLLDYVLVERPNDSRALWYGGLSASARGLNDLAVARFIQLLNADLPENMRMVVQQQLAQLGAEAPDQIAEPMVEEGDGMSVAVAMDIDPAIAGQVSPDGMLFVFARDAAAPGPPIAVKRVRVGSFPRTITLSNADAMVAGRKLEDAQQLKIVARISPSGNAIESPGDIYGEAVPTGAKGLQNVSLVIDSVVE
jgi:cytochrome c-type biogenesis protein CcmH